MIFLGFVCMFAGAWFIAQSVFVAIRAEAKHPISLP